MWQVVLALIPAGAWAVYLFGPEVLWIIGLSVGTAVITEWVIQKCRRVAVTITDGSAVVTGLLLAYVLPSHVPTEANEPRVLPWFVPVVGAAVAIGIAKQAFGGLGCNIWNPALIGRAFAQVAWPQYVSLAQWKMPIGLDIQATTGATGLAVRKGTAYTLAQQFFGVEPGCIGEVSAFLLILGGGYLIVRGYVNWRLPLAYLGSVAALVVVLPVPADKAAWWSHDAAYHLFAGGLMLGAFFMATDMVTSPLTNLGQWIFGLGCGILTVLIRFYTEYPEGVCYSILLMNTARPLIDRHTRPKPFGYRKEKAG